MARPTQRPALPIWSWFSASASIRAAWAGKRGPKPQTRRAVVIQLAVGSTLATARERAGLSQRETAAALCCSQPQVLYYEKGRDAMTIADVFEFADLYKIDVREVFEVAITANQTKQEKG